MLFRSVQRQDIRRGLRRPHPRHEPNRNLLHNGLPRVLWKSNPALSVRQQTMRWKAALIDMSSRAGGALCRKIRLQGRLIGSRLRLRTSRRLVCSLPVQHRTSRRHRARRPAKCPPSVSRLAKPVRRLPRPRQPPALRLGAMPLRAMRLQINEADNAPNEARGEGRVPVVKRRMK